MKKTTSILLVSLAASSALFGADSYSLQSITVTDGSQSGFFEYAKPSEPSSSWTYTKQGLEQFGRQTNMNALKVVEMSPSVNFSSVDIFGSNESSYHDPVRIRGKNQSGPGGILSVEGLPVNSNPGGGKTIYDMENFSTIDVYKGYMPVDKSLGFSNLIGKVDMTIDRPKNEFGVSLDQMVGMESASRTFIRVDTGKKGDIFAFGSVSYTSGDKNRGDGELIRANAMVGAVYKPNDSLKIEAFALQNRDDHNNYYQMTYSETKDMGKYHDKDYGTNPKLSGFADYNKQNFEDSMVMANIEYKPSLDSKISLKPYYLKDNGEYWFDTASSNPANTVVTQWLLDHELYGAVLKYEKSFSTALNAKLGYWAGRQQPPGPPVTQKKYNVAGGTPVFAGWVMLAKNDYHEFNSPFVEASGEIGDWSYSAGARYLNFKLGALRSYTNGTTAATGQSYDTAMANATFDPWASIKAKTYNELLPSFYLSYAAAKNASLYFDYTRSYGYDVNLFPSYVSNRATYVAKGVTLQQLFDKQKLEISDNYELGVKYKNGGVTYNPSLFMTKVTGKQVTVFDSALGVSYPTNSADAQSYGAELAVSGSINDSLDFMFSGSYNKYYYTQDLKTSATATAGIKNNQIPDAPQYTAKAAVVYKVGQFSLTPSVKYIDKRYGDVTNWQSVPSYTVVDLDATYTQKKLFGSKEAVFRLTLTNLFDQKYISSVITPDNALAANTTSTSYQSGAPFGAYLGVNFKF